MGSFEKDKKRYKSANFFHDHALRFLWILRKQQEHSNPLWKFLRHRMTQKYGLEISPAATIGDGLYLGHAFNITINPNVVIGSNCNIHKGVTIGQENRGKRRGAPRIGNCVWIGVNSTIVGRVSIGDDVLIAPNSYVNCDVPAHSLVLGNPCRIIPRDNATEGYINSKT